MFEEIFSTLFGFQPLFSLQWLGEVLGQVARLMDRVVSVLGQSLLFSGHLVLIENFKMFDILKFPVVNN